MKRPAQFYRTVELAPSQARLLATQRTTSAATLASWVSSADGAQAAGDGEAGGGTKSSLGGGDGVAEEQAGSLRHLLQRPMSAPYLVVGPLEEELGVAGSVSRRVISSPRGHAGHSAMLELLQYARSLRAKPSAAKR